MAEPKENPKFNLLASLFSREPTTVNKHPDLETRRCAAWIRYLDSQCFILFLLYLIVGLLAMLYGNKGALTAFGFIGCLNMGAISSSQLGCREAEPKLFHSAAALNGVWLICNFAMLFLFTNEGK